jgi:hypothetical protein
LSEQEDQGSWQSSARGEAAWKEATEAVATRNQQAHRAGKEERVTYERNRADTLRAAEERRRAELLARQRS